MHINHAALPLKLTLAAIQPKPLPKCWHFAVAPMAGWKPSGRLGIVLLIGDNPSPMPLPWQDQPGDYGFNHLPRSVLMYASINNLWGQAVQVIAVGGVAQTLNGALTWVAKSNPQMLQLPVLPFVAHGPHKLFVGDPPPAPVPTGMNPPAGRFLYLCRSPYVGETFPPMWYLRPDLSLEDQPVSRGFDRLTFWLAAFGVPIRIGKGLTTPEALAQHLGGSPTINVPQLGSAAAIVTAYHALSDHHPALMWTSGRIVVISGLPTPPYLAALEFDAGGLHKTDLLTWRNQQSAAVQWHFRQLKPIGAIPLQWGPGTLPLAMPLQSVA